MSTTYRGLTLDRFQRDAIQHIENDRSVIVSAPTGTGKTLIADYLIDHILEQGGEVIYTSPIKALSNQKYRQYTKLFGEEAIGLVTGDLVINRDAPVRIMTTEILRNILLEGRVEGDHDITEADASPNDVVMPDLARLKAVIIDEIHFLADPDRGTVWEEMLIYLPQEIRILGLSATLSNLDEFASWLSDIRGDEVEVILEERRTVPLRFSFCQREHGLLSPRQFEKQWQQEQPRKKKKGGRNRGGRDRHREDRAQMTRHVDVIDRLTGQADAFPALYFIFSRALVERLAGDLARNNNVSKKLGVRGEHRRQLELRLNAFDAQHPGVLTRRLDNMYTRGIAFHHAGLHVALKQLVEELYEAGLIKVLYCTSTFALGINMPARTVVFDALTKFNGEEVAPLTVREFMQMAGRAGRRGIDTEGDVVIRMDFKEYGQVQELLRQLLRGESEPVTSAFNLSFHTIANLLARFDEETIRAILQRSFMAYQSRAHAAFLRGEIDEREQMMADNPQAEQDDPHPRAAKRQQRHRRRLASLRRQLTEEERPRLWEEFQRKVEFLRSHGYFDEHGALLAPAKILQKIKIEEIFLTELIMSGALEELSDDELFGVMCGLVQSLPRTARVARPSQHWRALAGPIFDVYDSPVVTGAAELQDTDTLFTPDLMPLGARWAAGEPLADLMRDIDNPTDLSGDLVGAFRRAKDLIGQLRNVYWDDNERRAELGALIRKVTRDEVEVLD